MKLVVDAPSGALEIIEIGEGGGYFDPALVLWDERTQGPIPEQMLQDVAADALPARRLERWREIQAIRTAKTEAGGFPAAGKWFHSDVFSRTQQIGLTLLGANIPPGLQWKTMDGSFVTMTQTLAGQIFAAAAEQDAATFAHAEALRAAVNAAADPASVDITAGWPSTFAG